MAHLSHIAEGQAGDSVGVLLRGVKRDDIRRGMNIIQPGTASQVDQVEAQIYCLKKEEGGRTRPIVTTFLAMLYARTMDVNAELNFKGKDLMMPGEDSTVMMKLRKPIVLEQGTRFTLRDGQVTIGTGVVTKLLPNMTMEERKKFEKGRTRREREAFKEHCVKLFESIGQVFEEDFATSKAPRK